MQVFDRNKSVIAHLNMVPQEEALGFPFSLGILSTQKIMELYRHPKELKTMNPIKVYAFSQPFQLRYGTNDLNRPTVHNKIADPLHEWEKALLVLIQIDSSSHTGFSWLIVLINQIHRAQIFKTFL